MWIKLGRNSISNDQLVNLLTDTNNKLKALPSFLRYIDTVFLPICRLDKITTIELMPNLKKILFIIFNFVDYC